MKAPLFDATSDDKTGVTTVRVFTLADRTVIDVVLAANGHGLVKTCRDGRVLHWLPVSTAEGMENFDG